MQPRCVVTNTPAMQAWLRHYAVFDWPGRHGRVFANGDNLLLYPFVNDWMDRLLRPGDPASRREPRDHPFAPGNLRWRIYHLLAGDLPTLEPFEPIRMYLGAIPTPRRVFDLAGRLARLFDDYQVHRCALLTDWEREAGSGGWQGELWRRLTAGREESYAAVFRRMRHVGAEQLERRFDGAYRQVAVFGTTTLPTPYVSFFSRVLPQVVDVDVFVLNPCRGFWLESVTERVVQRKQEALVLQDCDLREDPLLVPEQGHELLCSLGEGLQEHLHILNDAGEGVNDESFVEPGENNLLQDLQRDMLEDRVAPLGLPPDCPSDNSIRIHICHSPRREVEVLHDHLLHWFTHEKLQPYQVQVLVTDMDMYGPYVEAVFGTAAPRAAGTIPYVVDRGGIPFGSAVLDAFRSILRIVSSRFPVSDIVDLLRGESVLQAFGLSSDDLPLVEQMVAAANVRWGLDEAHRNQAAGIPRGTGADSAEPFLTWAYGLDRLLAGYAVGEETPLGDLLPVDAVEGAAAEVLGKLARFIERLRFFRDAFLTGASGVGTGRRFGDWSGLLAELLDSFFVSTDTTCRDIAAIRRVVDELPRLPDRTGLGDDPIPFEVLAAHVDDALGGGLPGDHLAANAVIFCPLRPMNSRPADVVCVLGLNEGIFPRLDNRPTFDELGRTRKRGDPSRRRDDRSAFLEAIANARRRLFLSYVGRTEAENALAPPSIVIQELRDCLARGRGLAPKVNPDGGAWFPFEIPHRLHAIDPRYFAKDPDSDTGLFSYAESNLRAARLLVQRETVEPGSPPPPPVRVGATDEKRLVLDVGDLARFFQNPARVYYAEVLSVVLGVGVDDLPDDEETFDVDGLDRYRLWIDMLETLEEVEFDIAAVPVDTFTRRAKADGQLPLGAAGSERMHQEHRDLGDWLNRVVGVDWVGGATVRDLLRGDRQAEAGDQVVSVESDGAPPVVLQGGIRQWVLAGRRLQVAARPSKIKPKDRLRAWVSHLFASASSEGGHPTDTLLIGRDGTDWFRPLADERANRVLAELAGWYGLGRVRPLPFAPETSYAFADALGSKAASDKEALEAASTAWGTPGGEWIRECGDAWLFHAFGDAGPAAPEHVPVFAAAANSVWAPLLGCLAGHPPDAGGEIS